MYTGRGYRTSFKPEGTPRSLASAELLCDQLLEDLRVIPSTRALSNHLEENYDFPSNPHISSESVEKFYCYKETTCTTGSRLFINVIEGI